MTTDNLTPAYKAQSTAPPTATQLARLKVQAQYLKACDDLDRQHKQAQNWKEVNVKG